MRLRVYLVEDSATLLARLREQLEALSVDIVGDTDAAATAIREIAVLEPDVAIIDIALRQGTGFDVLRALSRRNYGPVPIVLTNYTSKPYRAAALRLGVEHYFDKNTDMFEMLRLIAVIDARSIGIRDVSNC